MDMNNNFKPRAINFSNASYRQEESPLHKYSVSGFLPKLVPDAAKSTDFSCTSNPSKILTRLQSNSLTDFYANESCLQV